MSVTFPARRIELTDQASRPYAAMLRLEVVIELDPRVRNLVRVRASQINGCAFCVDMH